MTAATAIEASAVAMHRLLAPSPKALAAMAHLGIAPLPVRLKAPAARDRLIALLGERIGQVTQQFVAGGSQATWEAAMRKALLTGHTAAYVAGAAQRLGVTADSALINAKRLSRAEKLDIAQAVDAQLAYLRRFSGQLGGMTPEAILARAQLYKGSLTSFYERARWGDWDIPPELIPGGQQCMGACKCSIDVKDNGDGTGTLTREMGGAEQHCDECPRLVGSYPVKRRGRT